MSENKSEYIVTDLTHDLGDGVLLPELTKALTKTNLIYREDPKLTFHRYVLFVIFGPRKWRLWQVIAINSLGGHVGVVILIRSSIG